MKTKMFQKILSVLAAATMTAAVLPMAMAAETKGVWETVVMNDFESESDCNSLGNSDVAGYKYSVEQNTIPLFVSEGSSSAKITVADDMTATDVLVYNYRGFKIPEGKIVMGYEFDAFSPNGISGSFYAYAKNPDGKYQNYAFKTSGMPTAGRTVPAGEWTTLHFDAMGSTALTAIYWMGIAPGETLYVDNMKVIFAEPDADGNLVVDDMDYFEGRWGEGLYCTGNDLWNLSVNTDEQYIKEGDGSIKVEFTGTTGENYTLFSQYYKADNVGGLKFPQIPGYEATSWSFWLYNEGANVVYAPGKNHYGVHGKFEQAKTTITEDGWHYISCADLSTVYNFIFGCTKVGNIYIDAVTVNYKKTEGNDIIIDDCEYPTSTFWKSKQTPNMFATYPDYVKGGLESIDTRSDAGGTKWLFAENNAFPIPQKEGKSLKSLGIWVYNTVASDKDILDMYINVGAKDPINVRKSLNFTGWTYWEIPQAGNKPFESIYGLWHNNSVGQTRTLYLDNLTAHYEDNFVLGASTLSNNDGALNIAAIEAGDVLKHTITAKKIDSAIYEYKMYIATFDGDGRLTGAAIDDAYFASTDTGDLSADVKLTVAENQEVAEVRGYVWTNGQAPVQTIIK